MRSTSRLEKEGEILLALRCCTNVFIFVAAVDLQGSDSSYQVTSQILELMYGPQQRSYANYWQKAIRMWTTFQNTVISTSRFYTFPGKSSKCNLGGLVSCTFALSSFRYESFVLLHIHCEIHLQRCLQKTVASFSVFRSVAWILCR